MTAERPISNSELKLMKRCRRKWWFTHWRKLTMPGDSHGTARGLGDRIHRTLAPYYDPTNTISKPAEVLQAWDDETVDLFATLHIDRHSDLQKDHDLGRAMLEGYFEWLAEEGADADLEPIASEHEVSIPMIGYTGPRPVRLVGKQDARVRRRTNGAQFFIDHKTVQNLTDIPKLADLDEQFLHYSLLDYLEHLANGADTDVAFCDGGLFNMLRKVKRTKTANPPFFGRHEVRHNLGELRSYWLRLVGEIADLQRMEDRLTAGEDPRIVCYPSPTHDCSWDCDFRAACPMVDDPSSDVEGFLAAAYVVGDPYSRYNATTEDAA